MAYSGGRPMFRMERQELSQVTHASWAQAVLRNMTFMCFAARFVQIIKKHYTGDEEYLSETRWLFQ